MKLSFVVPAYNEEAYISECLDCILLHAEGRIHEVIVVDNASTDRTSELAQSRAGVRIIHEPKRGVTFARQCGLQHVTGELLAYVDADCRISPNWIEIVEKSFGPDSDLVSLSGPYRYYDGPKISRWFLDAIGWSVLPVGFRLFRYMLVGGNFIVRKRALLEAGGFSENIDFFGEDTDLGRRLHARGKTQFRTDFFVWSSGRRFYAQGLVRANLIYFTNFCWMILFHRPFSKSHHDIREQFPVSRLLSY